MKEDTKNHIIDDSPGITSTHTETMLKLPIEKKYKKQQRMEFKKTKKCKETNTNKYIIFTDRILNDKKANHIRYTEQNYCWHQKFIASKTDN